MPYRKTSRYLDQLKRMRAAKERKRLTGPALKYPPQLPNLRRVIIIIDYDFSRRVHCLKLYRTNRIDCYRVEADGKPWKDRIGWSGILQGLRKALPRIQATT